MKLIIELESVGGEWEARLLAPDRVAIMSTFGFDLDRTVALAVGYVHTAAGILAK